MALWLSPPEVRRRPLAESGATHRRGHARTDRPANRAPVSRRRALALRKGEIGTAIASRAGSAMRAGRDARAKQASPLQKVRGDRSGEAQCGRAGQPLRVLARGSEPKLRSGKEVVKCFLRCVVLPRPGKWFVIDAPLPDAAVCGETLMLSRDSWKASTCPPWWCGDVGHRWLARSKVRNGLQ